MKKIVLAALLSTSIFSCKQEPTFDYKYADQPQVLTCENNDAKLFNEAYYAFENAIVIYAKNNNRRQNFTVTPEFALRSYIMKARGTIRITDYITKETLDVFQQLKTKDIWDGIQLKNNAAITECIGKNISNATIKGSFNTLRSVESLNPSLVATTITEDRTIRNQYNDKVLMTYVALDMFYSKFFNTNLSNPEFLVEKENVIPRGTKPKGPEVGKKINLDVKKPNIEKHGPHDGHNH